MALKAILVILMAWPDTALPLRFMFSFDVLEGVEKTEIFKPHAGTQMSDAYGSRPVPEKDLAANIVAARHPVEHK